MTAAQSPKISVVLAFLNGSNFLREAVDSVFAQTFTDWELILIDDGSTDESPDQAAALAKLDGRVRLLTHPGRANLGLATSRVLGSSSARGEYLIFLDHDDVFYPKALDHMASLLDNNQAASAIFAGNLFWAFDASLKEIDWVSTYGELGRGLVAGRHMLRGLIRSDAHHPAICSSLFRREAYLSARDAGPIYEGIYEDTALLFKLLMREDVYLLEEPVAAYRLHAASMCQRAKAADQFADFRYSDHRTRFLIWAVRHLPIDIRSRALAVVVISSVWLRRCLGRV